MWRRGKEREKGKEEERKEEECGMVMRTRQFETKVIYISSTLKLQKVNLKRKTMKMKMKMKGSSGITNEC